MADDEPKIGSGRGSVGSLSPADEAGGDLPSREGVPDWVPRGREERWRNSEKVATDLMGANAEGVWMMTRTIFHDEANYPD